MPLTPAQELEAAITRIETLVPQLASSISDKMYITPKDDPKLEDLTEMVDDGVFNAPSGVLTITENGMHDVAIFPNVFESVNVNVQGGITPSGNIALTATTTTQTGINVSAYATASVAPTPTETKTATANGTVTPTSGKFLSSVVVAIPTYDGSVEYV